MATGWVKEHRKLLDNPIFLKPFLLQLFTYCVLKANHNEAKIIMNGEEVVVEKGSFITGRKVIAEATGQTESAIYKRLKVLEKLSMISVKGNNRFSVVKVLNYSVYQGEELSEEQQGNNKVTTREQLGNTNKNVKNVKNVKKLSPSLHDVEFESFWDNYPRRKAKVDARKKWDLLMKKGVDPEKVISAAKKYAIEQKGKEVGFIKHAATFLGPGKHYEEYYGAVHAESKENTPSHNWNEMDEAEREKWR